MLLHQWRSQNFTNFSMGVGVGGVWGWCPQPPKARGLEVELLARAIFCDFSIKIMHFYAYFGQNSYFKAITHKLKAFKISLNVLNRINKVLFCSIRVNVSKFDVTFPQRGVLTPTPPPPPAGPPAKTQKNHPNTFFL